MEDVGIEKVPPRGKWKKRWDGSATGGDKHRRWCRDRKWTLHIAVPWWQPRTDRWAVQMRKGREAGEAAMTMMRSQRRKECLGKRRKSERDEGADSWGYAVHTESREKEEEEEEGEAESAAADSGTAGDDDIDAAVAVAAVVDIAAALPAAGNDGVTVAERLDRRKTRGRRAML